MGLMDKVRDFVSPMDEDDEDAVEETVETTAYEKPAAQPQTAQPEPQSRYERPKSHSNATALSANTKMVLFEPRSFGEAEEVGQRLKEARAVVVNLHKLDREYAQRTIDFLTGVVFALDGKIQKIGKNVFLCSPEEIGVQGSISVSGTGDYSEE